jgi:hypothetical protein
MATGKSDVLLLLLTKLLEDGNILYKKNRTKDASTRYQVSNFDIFLRLGNTR